MYKDWIIILSRSIGTKSMLQIASNITPKLGGGAQRFADGYNTIFNMHDGWSSLHIETGLKLAI